MNFIITCEVVNCIGSTGGLGSCNVWTDEVHWYDW